MNTRNIKVIRYRDLEEEYFTAREQRMVNFRTIACCLVTCVVIAKMAIIYMLFVRQGI